MLQAEQLITQLPSVLFMSRMAKELRNHVVLVENVSEQDWHKWYVDKQALLVHGWFLLCFCHANPFFPCRTNTAVIPRVSQWLKTYLTLSLHMNGSGTLSLMLTGQNGHNHSFLLG